MALEPDIVLVDELEAAEIGEAVRSAKPVREGGWIAVAMAGLVQCQHHIAAAGELDGEAVLGLARIDVAMDGKDARRRDLRRGIRRDVEQGAHGVALGALEPDILDPDAACGLREVGEQAPRHDQDHPQNRQRPSASHRRPPQGASPFNRRLKRAFTASLWLWLIAYPKAKRAQAAAFAPRARDSDCGFANAANPVISLEKMLPRKTGAKLVGGPCIRL